MSFSLIAVSDVHLDAPSFLDESERKKLEKHKKKAFKKAIDEAVKKNVSTFLIGGDLYNEKAVSFETLIFLRKCFLELESCGIKICYAHGKADPSAAPDIIKTPNLVDFSHEVESCDITQAAAIPVAIVNATGFSNNPALLAEQFEPKGSNYPTIGMLYDSEGFSNKGSFILDEIAGLNYDLFILGGYHHYILARAENNILYLGSPTGTWFDDKTGGALYAEVNDYGQIVLDKIMVSDVTWHDIEISNIAETDISTLTRRIEVEVQGAVSNSQNAYVRVTIKGRCIFADSLTDDVIEMMEKQLSETLDVIVHIRKSNLMPMLPKTLFDATSPLVESVKIIDAIKNDDDKFNELINKVHKEHELFYSVILENFKKSYRKKIKKGLLDTVCRLMIKEANYEN